MVRSNDNLLALLSGWGSPSTSWPEPASSPMPGMVANGNFRSLLECMMTSLMSSPTGNGMRLPVTDGEVPARVVIDTNVCLDLFIYRDAAAEPLMQALRSGRVLAVTRADCRDEWQRVLHYPQIGLDEVRRRDACAEYDTWLRVRSVPSALSEVAGVDLPRCSDPDDQKFLELALESGARTLLTKDKALLKLHRKTNKRGLYAILTPQAWNERIVQGGPGIRYEIAHSTSLE